MDQRFHHLVGVVFEHDTIEEVLHGSFVGKHSISITQHLEKPSIAVEG
jgi:hypothetical protein